MGEGDEFVENLSVIGDGFLFDFLFEFGEDLGHADHVTAHVVDEDVVFVALVANVTKLVLLAS